MLRLGTGLVIGGGGGEGNSKFATLVSAAPACCLLGAWESVSETGHDSRLGLVAEEAMLSSCLSSLAHRAHAKQLPALASLPKSKEAYHARVKEMKV